MGGSTFLATSRPPPVRNRPVADGVTFAPREHPVLVVDLDDKILPVAEFPEIASQLAESAVENRVRSVQKTPDSLIGLDETGLQVTDDCAELA